MCVGFQPMSYTLRQIAASIAENLRVAGVSCELLDPAPTATAFGTLVHRDRIVAIVALALLAALAGSYLLWLSADMGMGGMDMTGFRMIPTGMGLMVPAHAPWRAMEFVFTFAMWTVMMVGMMTSSAMPIILMYARVGRHTEAQHTPLVATVWFAIGYFLVWVAFALHVLPRHGHHLVAALAGQQKDFEDRAEGAQVGASRPHGADFSVVEDAAAGAFSGHRHHGVPA